MRFLEIDKKEILKKLERIKAKAIDNRVLKEIIFYDQAGDFVKSHRFIRLRQDGKNNFLAYKHHKSQGKDISKVDDVVEVEITVDSFDQAKMLLEKIGFIAFREQEKERQSFSINDCLVDIDTWPVIPTYLEIEGPTESKLKDIADKLGLDWDKAYFGSARDVIEKVYNINVSELHYFTFKKVG